jgi:hypothetical protein
VVYPPEHIIDALIRPTCPLGRHTLKTDNRGLHLRPPKNRVAARGAADGRGVGSIRGLVDPQVYAPSLHEGFAERAKVSGDGD